MSLQQSLHTELEQSLHELRTQLQHIHTAHQQVEASKSAAEAVIDCVSDLHRRYEHHLSEVTRRLQDFAQQGFSDFREWASRLQELEEGLRQGNQAAINAAQAHLERYLSAQSQALHTHLQRSLEVESNHVSTLRDGINNHLLQASGKMSATAKQILELHTEQNDHARRTLDRLREEQEEYFNFTKEQITRQLQANDAIVSDALATLRRQQDDWLKRQQQAFTDLNLRQLQQLQQTDSQLSVFLKNSQEKVDYTLRQARELHEQHSANLSGVADAMRDGLLQQLHQMTQFNEHQLNAFAAQAAHQTEAVLVPLQNTTQVLREEFGHHNALMENYLQQYEAMLERVRHLHSDIGAVDFPTRFKAMEQGVLDKTKRLDALLHRLEAQETQYQADRVWQHTQQRQQRNLLVLLLVVTAGLLVWNLLH
jgi:hypothetical protein